MKEPKILFYDIETTPLQAWVWRLGDQTVRHDQLVQGHSCYGIICITYCWNDNKPAKAIDWGYKEQDTGKVIKEFDKVVRQADVVIGKNSDKFDVKHINAQRMLHNLPPFPDWADCSDDLEKQLRRHFALPSYSLDYMSNVFGYGGKIKMELQDWVNIVNKTKNGLKSFRKMIEYGKKDTEDTREGFNRVKAYIKPKTNYGVYSNTICCTYCGSTNLSKNGTRFIGKTMYQRWECKDHHGYAGKSVIQCSKRALK